MFNKIQLTVFTLLVFVFCMAIFPIQTNVGTWNKKIKRNVTTQLEYRKHELSLNLGPATIAGF